MRDDERPGGASEPTEGPAPAWDRVSREDFLAGVERPTGELARHPADGWPRAAPWPMGKRTLRALHAIIDAVMPPPPAPRPEGIIPWIEKNIRFSLRYMPPLNAIGFTALVHILNLAPIWRFKHLSRLHRLTRDEADILLDGLANSRFLVFRQLLLAVKALVLSLYFDRDEVHEALDYHPVPYIRQRMDLFRRLEAGEEARPEDHIGPFSEEMTP